MDLVYPAFYRFDLLRWTPSRIELEIGAKEPTMTRLPNGIEDWAFTLRPDLRFPDDPCFPGGKGRQATAADVVYAFKRMADPATTSPIEPYVGDKILGFIAYVDGFKTLGKKHYDDPLPGVFVDPQDPLTFHVRLIEHYPQLKYILAMHVSTPTPREAVEKYGDAFGVDHWVGCGPCKLEQNLASEKIVLVPNTGSHVAPYPTETDSETTPDMLPGLGKPLPRNEKIVYTHFREELTVYNSFEQGYQDAIEASYSNAQVMPGAAALTPEMIKRGVKLKISEVPSVDWLTFNMLDSKFGGYDEKHRKLRQAISLAVDSSAYIDIICQGEGSPAQSIIPPGMEGYDPNYRNPYRQFDPNLIRAKQLLAEAGYPKGVDPSTGKPLVLMFDTFADTPALRQMERLFIQQIERLGIHVEPREGDSATYTDRIKKRQFQFAYDGWFADYPDTEDFLQLFVKNNWEPGPNDSMYGRPETDALYREFRGMDSGPERTKLIQKMRDIIQEDCPRIYLAHLQLRMLVEPWVSGAKPLHIGNEEDTYISVDPAKRTALQAEWNRRSAVPLLGLVVVVGAALTPAALAISKRRKRKIRRGSAA